MWSFNMNIVYKYVNYDSQHFGEPLMMTTEPKM
jgi:hypothetical protein